MALFGEEILIFSDKLKKINMYDWIQERVLAITNERIYNLKKTKIKRTILISKLGGATKSLVQGKMEFVVHVPVEYDYRFISERREEILDILKIRFMELQK
mmetsp:Transcript_40758/g.30011  ORF Transcript_40758/g.30011 Transcript_40758/m.30011 type:complete len:101 (-) Transcript_40758:1363-1665(-)